MCTAAGAQQLARSMGRVACIYLLVLWASQSGASSADAKGEPHTPRETSTESWLTNVVLIAVFLSFCSSTACWYVPSYGWTASREQPAASRETASATSSAENSDLPLLALGVRAGEGGAVQAV